MLRTTVAAAVVAALLAPTAAFAADAPPTAPGNPTVRLYPGAGGELFWSRSTDDRGVRGYEITVNGRSVGTRDATSHYDATLRANTAYTFTVTAIDSSGQRSPAATARVGGGASAPAASNPVATVPTASAPSAAGAPAAPSGLRASVYSASNAELFWTRASTPGLRYEVRRDGRAVTTTDGTSHYATGLSGGRDHAFQVVAIDASGRRSAPASVTVRTTGGASAPGTAGGGASTPSPAAPAPAAPASSGNGPDAPANATITVYSPTSAELFWTPQDRAGAAPVASNEIRRDGQLVATLTGYGTRSWFDGSRVPGRAHVYDITAVSSAGRATARVGGGAATSPAAPASPSVSGSGLPARLEAALGRQFALANGDAMEKVAAVAQRLATRPQAAGLRLTSTAPDPVLGEPMRSYACPAGGTATVVDGGTIPDGSRLYTLEASRCATATVTATGFFQVGTNLTTPVKTEVFASQVTVADARDGSSVRVERGMLGATPNRPELNYTFAEGLSVTDRAGTYTATRANSNIAGRQNGGNDGGLDAFAEGVAGALGTRSRMQTLTRFPDVGGGRPVSGALAIGSADGASYGIQADNGDPATFTFTASENGSTTSYLVPWSSRFDVTPADPASVDLGF